MPVPIINLILDILTPLVVTKLDILLLVYVVIFNTPLMLFITILVTKGFKTIRDLSSYISVPLLDELELYEIIDD